MVLELRYLRNLKVGTCSVGELENHKEDKQLVVLPQLTPNYSPCQPGNAPPVYDFQQVHS